ncbi:MAG TPA: hypothetical protein VHC69_21965 [Polyangiaceae bacterium]|nr:hypothetical protein [Polyangiaceae bacterium]
MDAFDARRELRQRKEEAQHGGDSDVHGRTSQRNQKLLSRVLWNPFEARYAANRVQRDVSRSNTVASCRERVPELVQHHHGENGDGEEHAFYGGRDRVPRQHVSQRDPREQDEKRPVDVDVDAPHLR